jgi:hypothetical protein
MSEKNNLHVFRLDKIPEGSRLERYLRELPESIKELKTFGLFVWRVFSECQDFVSQNYGSIDLPQLTLKIIPTNERFKLEEQRASERAESKEVAKGPSLPL